MVGMRVPAGSPHLPAFVSVATLAWLSPVALTAAESSEEIRQAIHARLPRYDPTAHAKAQAEKAAKSAPRNAPAAVPDVAPPAPAAPAPPPAGEKILELPKITIRSPAGPTIKRLPRVDPPPLPVKDLPAEPWESPTGRDARLVNKHLTKVEQKILGKWAIGKAREAEFRLQKAAQLDDLARVIEMQAALGLDPKEVKKLRDEYLKLYYSGPK